MKFREDINNLKEKEIYSLLLYAIYKCTGDPQYSTLSELIYTVDKDSLLNLCSIFGGCTIKIPTIREMKTFSNGLLVYNLMSQGKPFITAFKETGLDNTYKKDVAKVYKTLTEIIGKDGQ